MGLKFFKKFIKLVKITNCVCVTVYDVAYTATHTHTHTVRDFNQFYELLNEF